VALGLRSSRTGARPKSGWLGAEKPEEALFCGHGPGLTTVVDHGPHFTDAFGALCLALVTVEDVARTIRTRLDGEGYVTLAKAIAVADVHEARILNLD